MKVYLLIFCDCSDAGTLGRSIRAFPTAEAREEWARNHEQDKIDGYHGSCWYDKADVPLDGTEWTNA